MLVVKSLHIISMVSWFAALFYLPRLFVYHAMAEDKISRDRFEIMERKLIRAIGTPAMVATIIFGFWTAWYTQWVFFSQAWFHIKLTLVVFLVGYHHMCFYYMKQLKQNADVRSHVFFRIFNEIPVLFLIAIVFLVVFKQPS